jgi:hypothetical protein
MKRTLQVVSVVALAMLIANTTVLAQATAELRGTVRDTEGGVLPGADVTVTQTDTGVTRTTITDGSGRYSFTNLPTGPYRLEVNLPGFRAYQQTGIVLQVGGSPTINVTLGLGALEETISVQAATPLVDTQRAGVGEVIESERIIELPLNGRNPVDLIVLAGAAVQTDSASTRSFQGTMGGQGIAVAGGQSFGTAYLLDGALHNNPYDNLNLPLPFPDALQEFRVETGALSAGSGIHSGASVNAVTKSGTNRVRGDVFEFWRNHRLNATSPFAARDATGERQGDGLNRNQFGGTLGGPIIADRLFFFGGYQGTFVRQTPTDNINFVPTAQMLAGDFTAVASPQCTVGGVNLRGPFVNNQVTPALFSPAALELARRLPTTNDPCGRVVYGSARNTDEGQGIGRIDFQVGNAHGLFGRYMATLFDTPPPFRSSDNVLTSTQGGFDNTAHSLTLGHTWVVSNATVSSLRFAWNNTRIMRVHEPMFSGPDLGINMFSFLDDYFILNVQGAFGVGSGVQNLAQFDTTTFQGGNDLTMIRGDHQFSFGTNVARWDSFSTAHVRSPGTFTVNGQVTGLPLADFLLGNVSQFIQAQPNFLDMNQWYLGMYAADSWRLTPTVTLNYGLRWEPFFPQQLPNGFIYNFALDRFRQGVKSGVFRNAPAGFVYPGDPEFVGGNSGMNRTWTNFAPRASASWDPAGDGRTAIQVGYSLGYDFVNAQYHLNTSVAPPWGADVRVQDTILDDPFASFPGGNPFPITFDADAPFPPFGQFLAVDPDTRNTRKQTWNVSVDRQVGSDMAVSASYIGNYTDNLWNMRALNPGRFLGLGPCTLPDGSFHPVCSTQGNLNQRRALMFENPQEARFISALDFHDASGTQDYHGLLLSFRRRAAQGLSYSANYTLSRCEGHPTTSLPNVGTGWADPDNPDYDRGPCDSDRRHLFNMTAGVQTPEFDRAAMNALLSGWRVNGIFRARSGAPLTVNTGVDRAMTGIVTNQRADQVLDDGYGDRTVDSWLNRAAFAQPALGTLGDSPRGGFRGPGRWTIDLVLARMFRVAETHRVEVRAEAFNLTNNFLRNNPISNLQNANFGRILSAGDPRILQFGVKYAF